MKNIHKLASHIFTKSAVINFTKPVRVWYDNDADGIFSAYIFKYYSGALITSMNAISAGFDLKKDDNIAVVLDARSKNGNEDLRIDHHQGGAIKPNDVVDTSYPSCAGLVAKIFNAPINSKVLQEMNNLDSGKPTVFNWDQAEKKLDIIPKEAFEDWNEFVKLMKSAGIDKLEVSTEPPGPIKIIGKVKTFGNWNMPGVETDKYNNYFINIEYPKGEAFTVLGRMNSDKKPDEPFQIFIANSPARKDLNIGAMLIKMKQQYGITNAGGRENVGGCNFKDEKLAQTVYGAILNVAAK